MNKLYTVSFGLIIVLIASGYTIKRGYYERNLYHATPRNAGGQLQE